MSPRVGTLERRNPLPDGTYWVDVFGFDIPKADLWFKTFGPFGVHVDATQHFENTDVSSVRNWYKFTLKTVPGGIVVWDTTLGFPTVADASIQSSEDTVQRPDLPIDPLNSLGDWIESTEHKLGDSLGSVAKVVPYALIGGLAYLTFQLLKGSTSAANAYRKVKTSVRRVRK